MMNRSVGYRTAAASLALTAGLALAQDFPQNFDDIGALTSGNWFTQNNSEAPNIGYFQGNTAVFPPQASLGYLGVNFNSTAGVGGTGIGTISNWFVTPALNLANGQVFTFYTRTVSQVYPDRLQVRLSTNGFSTNVGPTGDPNAVGDFTTLLLDVNPTLTTTGYPIVWTQYTINISGLPAPTVGRIAFRYFVTGGGPHGANSHYIGIDEATYNGTVATVPTGSCCLPNATCQVLTENECITRWAGVYGGNATTCGACPTAFGYVETNDVGDLPGTAAVLNGNGSLTKIVGTIELDDADMYRINVCDRTNFSATTSGGPQLDSVLFLFNTQGVGLAKDDEGGPSGNHALVTGQFIPANGEVYLAISGFDRDPIDSGAQRLWNETNPSNGYEPEWAPNGPGAANPVNGWVTFTAEDLGNYVISLTGATFVGTPCTTACYANCDGSTATPLLTANDFQCFINKYAGNDPYANCDGSTAIPALTANDFQCFINKYAGGCT